MSALQVGYKRTNSIRKTDMTPYLCGGVCNWYYSCQSVKQDELASIFATIQL